MGFNLFDDMVMIIFDYLGWIWVSSTVIYKWKLIDIFYFDLGNLQISPKFRFAKPSFHVTIYFATVMGGRRHQR